MEASFCQMPFAFLYDNHPGPGGVLLLVCLAMLAGAIFPGFFSKEEDLPWSFRLYLGLAGLLGLGPLLFGKGGAALYPVFFAAASVVTFLPLRSILSDVDQSEQGRPSLASAFAIITIGVILPQTFLQLLSLHSVARISIPLFWLWAVPLILTALLALWNVAYLLLFFRRIDASAIFGLWSLLALFFLGHLGRIGAVEHYGVPVPGSFWEAPEYTVEAMAKVEPYGEDGKTGRPLRARIGIKVGSVFDSYEDDEGREHSITGRVGRILWIEIAGIKRPIVEQEGTLYMESLNDSVLVQDKFGKSYRIDDNLDFKDARKP
jgi:hypothetical protein